MKRGYAYGFFEDTAVITRIVETEAFGDGHNGKIRGSEHLFRFVDFFVENIFAYAHALKPREKVREIVFARVAFFRNLVQSEFPLEILVDISEDGFHRHAFVEKGRSVFGAVYQPENVHYERSGNVLANFHIKPFFKFEFGD